MNAEMIELPASLRQRLQAFEKRLYRMETVVFICGGLCGLLASWFLLYISDRFWNTPYLVRLAFMLGGVLSLAAFSRFWFRNWFWRRRDVCQMARLIQREFPFLGDRLLGIIELADPGKRTENISPQLCRAAIEQVALESSAVDFREAVQERTPKRLGVAFALCGLLGVCLIAVDPRAVLNTLRRWVQPLSPVKRYTFVSLSPLPDTLVVARGEDFEIPFRVLPTSRWIPGYATYECGDEPERRVTIRKGNGVMALLGQTRDVGLTLRAGDAIKEMQVRPIYRPALLNLSATVKLPAYLRYPDQTVEVPGKTLKVLEGSRFVLVGKINRALGQAVLEDGKAVALTVSGDRFTSPSLSASEFKKGILTWKDTYGLSRKEAYAVEITLMQDQPPTVDCPELARGLAVLEGETKLIRVRAEDEYGVKRVAMQWGLVGKADDKTIPEILTSEVGLGGPTQREVTGVFTFNSDLLEIPPDSQVRLRAVGWDYKPNNVGRSAEYIIWVLSHAEHARLIRQEFEALQAKLEELVRAEEDLLEANQNLKALADDKLKADESTEKLKESEKGESINADDLKRLTEKGLQLMKEGLRNKEFPAETLKEWAKLLDALDKVAGQDMKDVKQSLGQARENKEQRRKDLEKAVEQQRKLLEKLRKLQESMGKSIDQMIARNFVNRLRKAASQETTIRQGLQGVLARSIGLDANSLPKEVKTKVAALAGDHKDVGGSIKDIKEELLGFFNRTRVEKYQLVHDDMEKRRTLEELDKLTETIGHNQTVNGIKGAEQWAKTFNAWADMLQKKGNEKSPDGQGEGQELTDEQIELLLAIMRIVSGEQDLRDSTRGLDNRTRVQVARVDNENGDETLVAVKRKLILEEHGEKAAKLGDTQKDLHKMLDDVAKKLTHPDDKQLIGQVALAMNEAEGGLRGADTGIKTITAENLVIELLTQTGEACCSRMGKGGGAMMSALMRMMRSRGMGSGAGSSPGGSNAGGLSNRPNEKVAGDGRGAPGEARTVEKGTGRTLERVPVEFRDALESYYKKLDEKGK